MADFATVEVPCAPLRRNFSLLGMKRFNAWGTLCNIWNLQQWLVSNAVASCYKPQQFDLKSTYQSFPDPAKLHRNPPSCREITDVSLHKLHTAPVLEVTLGSLGAKRSLAIAPATIDHVGSSFRLPVHDTIFQWKACRLCKVRVVSVAWPHWGQVL